MTCSASTGPPRSMSFSIDAEIGEPAAVRTPRKRSIDAGRGAKPLAAAMARHSSSSRSLRSAAPAATMSPMLARIRQVIAAAAAMKTHFSHSSSSISDDTRASNLATFTMTREKNWGVTGQTGLADLPAGGFGQVFRTPYFYTVQYTATLSFYRRDALAHVGGYESRLQSEEDFELGLRLRQAGYPLRTLAPLAAKHWSAPRPSFSEVGRRWRTGLCFGPGQALRLYLGRSGFMALAVRNAHYFATLALWLAAPVAIAMGGALALAAWAIVWLALFALLAVRKKSPRLALHSLVTWTVMAAGTVVGFVRGGVAAPAPVREVA